MKLYLNLKNAWKIFISVFILSSCSDIGGIVEIAVKDGVNSHFDSRKIIQNIDNTNLAISSKEKISQNNTNIQTFTKDIASPRYKIGNPYEIKNIWYYPKRDLTYDETGIASWYGNKFAGKLTANGEIFEPNKISAAHKTLPMPSAVKVTNLKNNKSLIIRVNDRGPFVNDRIIDLSYQSAKELKLLEAGTGFVRVQLLRSESLLL